MKKILIIISMIAALITFNSCGRKNDNVDQLTQLKKDIEAANKECPFSMGMVGDMLSMKYDEEANEVQLYIAVADDMFSVEAFQKNPEMAKQLMKMSLVKDKPAELYQMVKAGAGLSITFKSNQDGNTFKIALPLEELKEIKDNFMSEKEMDKIILENKVAIENNQCPYYIEDGMQMIEVYDDGTNIVGSIQCDEELYDIETLKYAATALKENFKTTLSDPTLRNNLELCYSLGKGMTYHFYGDKSGESVDISFTVEEIEELL